MVSLLKSEHPLGFIDLFTYVQGGETILSVDMLPHPHIMQNFLYQCFVTNLSLSW